MRKERISDTADTDEAQQTSVEQLILLKHEEWKKLPEQLRRLIEKANRKQGEVAAKIGIPPSHFARWLKESPARYAELQLPARIIYQIADELGRDVWISLIDSKLLSRRNGVFSILSKFYLGLAAIEFPAGPQAIVGVMADVWNADGYSLYREDARTNILDWARGAGISHSEAMYGISWSSDLPRKVLESDDGWCTFDWTSETEQSSFATRERYEFTLGLSISDESIRSGVAFLNFKKKPPYDFSGQAVKSVIVAMRDQLRLAIVQAWGAATRSLDRVNQVQSGGLHWSGIVELAMSIVRLPGSANSAISDGVAKQVCDLVRTLWTGLGVLPSVYAWQYPREVHSVKEDEAQNLLKAVDTANPPDRIVCSAAVHGATYYVDNLENDDVRRRLDPSRLIPISHIQKAVVPFRAEPLLNVAYSGNDWANGPSDEFENHQIFQHRTPKHKKDLVWGVLSVNCDEVFLSKDKLWEMSVLAHATSILLHLLQRTHSVTPTDPNFAGQMSTILRNIIQDIKKYNPVERKTHPLSRYCELIIKNEIFPGMERCEVYPYDHIQRQFIDGGGYFSKGWFDQIKRYKILLTNDRVAWLTPRHGGMSERLLGTSEEFHFIRHVARHPRVNPVAKTIKTATLMGGSCRIGSSFRTEAIMWLGARHDLDERYLDRDSGQLLLRLRVTGAVAALICVLMRCWGRQIYWKPLD